ncbi:LuxR C-terminal-related transcriptional regulator [Pseudoalteromonas mariniglutinosa]|uniref:response regulator transcription factor n=1 Tax=Pseudoalteromonas mariniglutinosa TaxID=206042 RepID=UPI003850277C
MSTKYVVIADDHPMYLEALSTTLRNTSVDIKVEAVKNYTALFELLHKKKNLVDLVIADLLMPDGKGVKSIEYLCSRFTNIPLILLSGQDDFVTKQDCLDAGAKAFISKCEDSVLLLNHVKKLLEISSIVQSSRIESLTPTQYKVLKLIAQGFSNKQIAGVLGIAEKTVKVHVSMIFEKLGVKNRTQAALSLVH